MAPGSKKGHKPLYSEHSLRRRVLYLAATLAGALLLTVALAAGVQSLRINADYFPAAAADWIRRAAAVILERGSIPYFESFFFFFALLWIVMRYVDRRRERRLFCDVRQRWQLIQQNRGVTTISPDESQETLNIVKLWERPLLESRAGKRIYYALQRYVKTRSSKEVDDLLANMSEMDASAADSSYSILRYFVWLIPTLGFIGTVVGISSGIDKFGTDVNSLQSFSEVQKSLPGVTHDLSIAFDTTLLALILTAILLAIMSYARKREDDLLTEIDHLCVEEIAGSFEEGDSGDDRLSVKIKEHLENHAARMERALAPLAQRRDDTSDTSALLKTSLDQLTEEAKAIRAIEEEARGKLQKMVELFDDLTAGLGEHLGEFADWRTRVQDRLRELHESAQGVREDFASLADRFGGLSSLGDVGEAMRAAAEDLKRLAAEGAAPDAAQFNQAVIRLEKGLDEIRPAFENVAAALQRMDDAMQAFARLEELLRRLDGVADMMQAGGDQTLNAAGQFAEAGEQLKLLREGLTGMLAENKTVMESVRGALEETREQISLLCTVIGLTNQAIQAVQTAVQQIVIHGSGRGKGA